MMRRLILVISPLLFAWACGSDKKNGSFELKGELTNTNGETLYLEKLATAEPLVVDSAIIDAEGKFEFINHTPDIGFYRIRQNQQNFAMLVLDSTDKIKVTGDLTDLGNTYEVQGSAETDLFIDYNEIAKKRDIRLDSINSLAQVMMEPHKTDQRKMEEVTAQLEGPYNSIVQSSNKQIVDKIMDNTDKYASIMAVQALDPDQYADVYKALDDGLYKKFPGDRNVKMFHDMVTRQLSTSIGQTAPDIKLPSPDGKELALSDYRGKVVLVDFWASWCGPCRREMPNVVKAYNRFKDEGFEIFGVSLDQEKERWVEAIASDNITWPQVSDLRNWQSEAARLYNVQSIPYTVLVDRDGKILAKNLRGEELENKIAEVLGLAPSGLRN